MRRGWVCGARAVVIRLALGPVPILVAALSAAGCDISGQSSPLSAEPSEGTYVLASAVKIRPSGGDSRELRSNSVWVKVGTVAQGVVYKPRDTVLTAEGFDVHEAY